MSASEIPAQNTSPAADQPPAASEAIRASVGDWPEPAPSWGVVVTAILWVVWVGFLIWMMILRINTDIPNP